MAQYDTFRSPEKVAFLQKKFLKAKLESQIRFLQSLHRPEVQEAIDRLSKYLAGIEKAKVKHDRAIQRKLNGGFYKVGDPASYLITPVYEFLMKFVFNSCRYCFWQITVVYRRLHR